ncbi:4Fe-4S binding protein [Bradyrhizobium sp. 23AC]
MTIMAYKIVASQCTACGACEFDCPNGAVNLKRDVYVIDPKTCTECEGHFGTPQCAAVCPVPNTCVPA